MGREDERWNRGREGDSGERRKKERRRETVGEGERYRRTVKSSQLLTVIPVGSSKYL